jgi:lipoprotein-anchoring transpeptidase ErfK/SrfK
MSSNHRFRSAGAFVVAAGAAVLSVPALAQPLALFEPARFPSSVFEQVMPNRAEPQPPPVAVEPAAPHLPAHLRRQIVDYPTREPAGTIVIDTGNTFLYYVLGGGKAIRYGIGVGREGFTWSGIERVSNKAEWPDWHPPADMIKRQPYLPRFTAGGPGNPLGARALYLGNTVYRIHGTNAPETIGQNVSSGCIRMLNDDVVDLYNRVNVGTKVVVLPGGPRQRSIQARAPEPAAGAAPAAHQATLISSSPTATIESPRGMRGVY